MTKRKRFYLAAGIAVVALIVSVAALWLYAAFRPTGIVAAAAKVELLAKTTGLNDKLSPKRGAPPAVAVVAQTQPAARPQPTQFQTTMTKLEMMRSNKALFQAAAMDLAFARRSSGLSRVIPLDGTTGAAGSPEWSLDAEQATAITNEVRSQICMKQSQQLLPAALTANAERNRESIAALNKALDDAEILLLDPGLEIPAYWDVPFDTGTDAATIVTEWCIMRAAAKGDEQKTGALIDKWRQLYRISWLAQYPNPTNPYYSMDADAWQFVIRLGQIHACPKSVFVTLADTFQQMRFRPEELDVIGQKQALAKRRMALEMVNSGVYRRENAFSYFMNGSAQQLSQSMIQPVFDTELDDFTIAWNAHDAKGATAAWISLRSTENLLNLHEDAIGLLFLKNTFNAEGDAGYFPGVLEDQMKYRLESDLSSVLTDGPDMALFLTACSLHHLATGAWPASPADLNAEEKSLVGYDKLGLRFQVEQIPTFRGPAMDDPMATGSGAAAISSFFWRQHRPPESMAEVRKVPNATAEQNDRYDRLFINFDARPEFIGLRPMPEKDPRRYAIGEKPGAVVSAAWPDPVAPGFVVEWLFGSDQE